MTRPTHTKPIILTDVYGRNPTAAAEFVKGISDCASTDARHKSTRVAAINIATEMARIPGGTRH